MKTQFQRYLKTRTTSVTLVVMAIAGWVAFEIGDPVSSQTELSQSQLIARGRNLFFNETFNGNGRTCGTCHPANNNFTIDPAFIAKLPPTDPLFVAEFVPALKENFEKPELMRKFGLILENLDGFDDLPNKFTMRGVPHTLGMRVSVDSQAGPRTGWSGDGAPGDGTLRSFATGAVIQHFTRTLNRVPGVDFRLPTEEELDAMEAFQASLGRQAELTLPIPMTSEVARRGQEIFLDNSLGKCNICHFNAGANANLGGPSPGNSNFNTGVEDLPDQPGRLVNPKIPRDDGFGRPGDGTFNTPSIVEAADTGPFFHNNAIETIEGAVTFYNGDSFKNSPSGQFLARTDPNGVAIKLDATQVVAVAAFLRVINSIENIRQGIQLLEDSLAKNPPDGRNRKQLLDQAVRETSDSYRVLESGGLNPEAVAQLKVAQQLAQKAIGSWFSKRRLTLEAIDALKRARGQLVSAP